MLVTELIPKTMIKAKQKLHDNTSSALNKVEELFIIMNEEFDKQGETKEEIIRIMKQYLPNFEHIEIRKFLDSKM